MQYTRHSLCNWLANVMYFINVNICNRLFDLPDFGYNYL